MSHFNHHFTGEDRSSYAHCYRFDSLRNLSRSCWRLLQAFTIGSKCRPRRNTLGEPLASVNDGLNPRRNGAIRHLQLTTDQMEHARPRIRPGGRGEEFDCQEYMYRNLCPGEYLPMDSIAAQPITRRPVPLDRDKMPCDVTFCPGVIVTGVIRLCRLVRASLDAKEGGPEHHERCLEDCHDGQGASYVMTARGLSTKKKEDRMLHTTGSRTTVFVVR